MSRSQYTYPRCRLRLSASLGAFEASSSSRSAPSAWPCSRPSKPASLRSRPERRPWVPPSSRRGSSAVTAVTMAGWQAPLQRPPRSPGSDDHLLPRWLPLRFLLRRFTFARRSRGANDSALVSRRRTSAAQPRIPPSTAMYESEISAVQACVRFRLAGRTILDDAREDENGSSVQTSRA